MNHTLKNKRTLITSSSRRIRAAIAKQPAFAWSRLLIPIALAVELIGVSLTSTAIASSDLQSVTPLVPFQQTPVLIATAYTDLTLPTLRRGDSGKSVQLLQKILTDNGFLGAAGVSLGNPQGSVVDGIFGPITESAVKDLQQRYNVPVTGQVNPQTWEVIDINENPYRSPLPWK